MDAPKRKRGRPRKRGAPAMTVEARENQLISLAVNLAEEQLASGTASAQVITHFLRLGTMRAKLEMEKLKQETLLAGAKTEAIQSGKKMDELYEKAIMAMVKYKGNSGEEEVLDENL